MYSRKEGLSYTIMSSPTRKSKKYKGSGGVESQGDRLPLSSNPHQPAQPLFFPSPQYRDQDLALAGEEGRKRHWQWGVGRSGQWRRGAFEKGLSPLLSVEGEGGGGPL